MKKPESKQLIFQSLRSDLQLFEDRNRSVDTSAWLLYDPVGDKYFHIGKREYLILSLFDDATTADVLLKKVKKLDANIEIEDVRNLLFFLHNNNLLKPTHLVTENVLKQKRAFKKAKFFNKMLHSYLFFRMPVWNPDKFLDKTLYIVQALTNRWLILIVALVSAFGYVSLIANWGRFEAALIGTLNYAGLFKYSLAIVILKVLHEFAHAFAAKSAGVRVRRFGVGLIVFFPRLFTDLTDTWRLDNRKRLLIDSAGILLEITIGGIAVLFWIYSGPGVIKNIAYYVFAVSVINTLLVNGNPFIKFDGYYILSDLLNIDNLQLKSIILIKKIFREKFFGIKTPIMFTFKGWLKYFIVIYGISAFIYRLFLYTGIILIVYFKFTKAVGVLLAAIEVYIMLIKPFYTEISTVIKFKSKAEGRKIIITLSALIIIILIVFLPLPWTLSLPCIVDSSKNRIIYAQEPGFLKKIESANHSDVTKNQPLLKLENPFLNYDQEILKVSLKIRETELDQMQDFDVRRVKESKKSKVQQILHLQNSIKENQRKMELLNIKSPVDGKFVLFDWHLKPGKWFDKGMPIGEVYSPKHIIVHAYTDEKNIDRFKLGEPIKVYLYDNTKLFKGKVIEVNPVPIKEWPEPSPLLDISGGQLPVLKQKPNLSYVLKDYYYEITIKPETNYDDLEFSRTGLAQTKKFSSIGFNFIRTVISVVQRELSF